MSEKKEFFADGIGQIHFAGGMVRRDFVTLAPEVNGKAPSPRSNRRVILSPQGFPGGVSLHTAADWQAGRYGCTPEK